MLSTWSISPRGLVGGCIAVVCPSLEAYGDVYCGPNTEGFFHFGLTDEQVRFCPNSAAKIDVHALVLRC